MYKIALCGKANSGKDTVAKLIVKTLNYNYRGLEMCPASRFTTVAFADPIKKLLKQCFRMLKTSIYTDLLNLEIW